MRQSKGFTLIELLIVVAIILVLALALTGSCAPLDVMPNYSNGERVGYVTKFSQKGLIWKTWEGEMQVGQGEMAALQEPWRFSVRDPAVIADLKAAQASGQRVRLAYREYLVQALYHGDTDYEVILLKALGERRHEDDDA